MLPWLFHGLRSAQQPRPECHYRLAGREENITRVAVMNPRLNIETRGTHLNRRANEFTATRPWPLWVPTASSIEPREAARESERLYGVMLL
jgi:hypothetical protein